MKKILVCFIAFCCVSIAQATEIAVVDFRAALLQSNIGQEASKGPKQQVAQMDAALQQEQKALETSANELKRDELTLSQEEFQQRRQDLAERQNRLRGMAANMQRQAKELEQELIESLTPTGEAALKSIIEERNLELVLNRQLSLYASAAADITDELVMRINKDN